MGALRRMWADFCASRGRYHAHKAWEPCGCFRRGECAMYSHIDRGFGFKTITPFQPSECGTADRASARHIALRDMWFAREDRARA